MIRTTDFVNAIEMSRVERNQQFYTDNAARKGSSIAGRLLSVIGILLMVLVAAACLSLTIPKIAGYSGYVVVSGSMEPAIPVGSMVYSKPADPATLQTGDVIVFVDESRGTTPITHRVVSNDTASGTITTKGDANEHQDINPVTYDNVVGKVVMHIPHIGFTAAALTSVLGKAVAVLIMLEGWLLTEIGRRLRIRN